jgi:hypothetical protein
LPPLSFVLLRIAAQVDNVMSQSPPSESLLTGQTSQQVVDRRAVAGESDGAIEPKAVLGKDRGAGQGVVAGVVVDAGEVAVFL